MNTERHVELQQQYYEQEERQSRHSWKARTSSSSEKGSQDQERIKRIL